MADIALSCPECGGPIHHSCGANLAQPPPQSLAQISEGAETAGFAHGFEVQDLAVRKSLSKSYNKGYDQAFLVFWSVYPLKRDKRKAQLAWRKSVRRLGANADAETVILLGAIRYRNDPNRVDAYTKYAEGWLNGDGWEDEPLPARKRGKSVSNLLALADEVEG
jgi:hypothetical protein